MKFSITKSAFFFHFFSKKSTNYFVVWKQVSTFAPALRERRLFWMFGMLAWWFVLHDSAKKIPSEFGCDCKKVLSLQSVSQKGGFRFAGIVPVFRERKRSLKDLHKTRCSTYIYINVPSIKTVDFRRSITDVWS